MILIEAPDGRERCLVNSLDGYADWRVVASDVDQPEDDSDWDEKLKRWKPNVERRAQRAKLRRVCDPQALADTIAELEARIAALEALNSNN